MLAMPRKMLLLETRPEGYWVHPGKSYPLLSKLRARDANWDEGGGSGGSWTCAPTRATTPRGSGTPSPARSWMPEPRHPSLRDGNWDEGGGEKLELVRGRNLVAPFDGKNRAVPPVPWVQTIWRPPLPVPAAPPQMSRSGAIGTPLKGAAPSIKRKVC